MDNEQMKAEITLHMARAFFASAWADAAEEANAQPWPMGGEIMAHMPETVDPAAVHAAATLVMDMERVNGMGVVDILARVRAIIAESGKGVDREPSAKMFGHYAAMQAMGHGVGLDDAFGQEVYSLVQVPYVEFGEYSLSRDYFGQGVE